MKTHELIDFLAAVTTNFPGPRNIIVIDIVPNGERVTVKSIHHGRCLTEEYNKLREREWVRESWSIKKIVVRGIGQEDTSQNNANIL